MTSPDVRQKNIEKAATNLTEDCDFGSLRITKGAQAFVQLREEVGSAITF